MKPICLEVMPNTGFQNRIQFQVEMVIFICLHITVLQFFSPHVSQAKFLYGLFGAQISLFCSLKKKNQPKSTSL